MSKPPKPDGPGPVNSPTINLGSVKAGSSVATNSEENTLQAGSADQTPEQKNETQQVSTVDTPVHKPVQVTGQRQSVLTIGECFQGKYEIIQMLGAGGMGQVFQARHIDLGTMVDIKGIKWGLNQD